LGYQFNRNDIDYLYRQFLNIADSKKEVLEEDLRQIANQYQPEAAVA
jgi:2-isopropylmalate synthase